MAAATPVTSGTAVAGNIERSGDQDWFTFAASAGTATVNMALVPSCSASSSCSGTSSSSSRTNLDTKVALFNASGTQLASWDPQVALLSGSNSFTLPAGGQYYLSVTGTGETGIFTLYGR